MLIHYFSSGSLVNPAAKSTLCYDEDDTLHKEQSEQANLINLYASLQQWDPAASERLCGLKQTE